MLFAINYSHPAADLFSAGRLPIDRFKCPNWPWMIEEALPKAPVAVHYNIKAGCDKLRKIDWQEVEFLLKQTGTPHVNVHLETECKTFPHIPQDSQLPEHRQQVIEQMLLDLEQIIERFGADQVIAENSPYRPSGDLLRLSVEPEVISTVIESTGVGLLLDVPHARISAFHLGMDETVYISALPVHCLREMHFTGTAAIDGWLQDHVPAQPADWQALEWSLEHIRQGEWPMPWMLAFEYGGVGGKFTEHSDSHVIETQASRLSQLLKSLAG